MIYPALLALVGLGSILVLLNFVVPRFAAVFEESRMKIPAAHEDHAGGQPAVVQNYWWMAALAGGGGRRRSRSLHRAPRPAGSGGTRCACAFPVLGDALRKAETARFARAMATLVANSVPLVQSIGIAGGHSEQPPHRRRARNRGARRQARRRHRRADAQSRRRFRRWPRTC